MKALTLWQPWATFVADGVKTIETRSWSTKYRGPLAIHAAARRPNYAVFGEWCCEDWWDNPRHVDDCECDAGEIEPRCARRSSSRMVLTRIGDPTPKPLPLGAVIAVCELVDVIPMVTQAFAEASDGRHERLLVVEHGQILNIVQADHSTPVWTAVEDQRPFGDFAPGRYAWLLENVRALEPIEATGHQSVWEYHACADCFAWCEQAGGVLMCAGEPEFADPGIVR